MSLFPSRSDTPVTPDVSSRSRHGNPRAMLVSRFVYRFLLIIFPDEHLCDEKNDLICQALGFCILYAASPSRLGVCSSA